MASSPQWKIYNAAGKYVGCLKDVEDAALLVAGRDGWAIRWGHGVTVWREGAESQSAVESYDHVAATVHARVYEYNVAALKKSNGGKLPEWPEKIINQ